MNKFQKIIKSKITWFLILLVVFGYLNNSSWLVKPDGKPLLLAHRGLAQTYPMEGITADTNTAARIYPPEHPYIENTIASMEAAFQAGADIVEFDIHPTTDGQFAVFHDWILEYRTNGKGVTREHPMAELKMLDVGYGYTADQGKTFPFRGKGVGLMPTLDEVMKHFPPSRSFLIHIKSDDPKEGKLLAAYLQNLPKDRLKNLAVYGGDQPIEVLKQKLPSLKVMSKKTVMRAFIPYLLVGWTGYIPAGMKNAFFYLPLRYTRFLWGWPHRLVDRMKDADSIFVVVNGQGQWSEAFDTAADLKQIPSGYSGGIWTERIDRIAPLFKPESGK